jgi:amino acid adenylation domain-containing protein
MTTRESPPGAVGIDDNEVFRVPTSFAQERLWFLDQFEPESTLYNLMISMRIRGTVDIAALQRAIATLVERHETLRTIFGMENGRPIQIILPRLQLEMPIEDLTHIAPDAQASELSRWAQAERAIPFRLTEGPLVRVHFLKLSDTDYGLLLTFHHIIYDGWSAGVFFRELNQLYQAYVQGQSLALPELVIQYADYATWQKEWLQGDALTQEMTFWKEHLTGAPGLLEVPGDRPRPAVQTFQGGREEFAFTLAQTEAIDALGRTYSVTPFMLLLAAWEVLLGRYTSQTDFVIGTPIAGRTRVELEPLIGFFANTLVLRADLSGDPTFAEVLKRVRNVALDAFSHQDVPFEKLVEELHPERSLSYNPLFQVMFSYQNTPDQEVELADLSLTDIEVQRVTAKFDLTLSCWREDGLLKGGIEYNTDIFDAATITRLQTNFMTLLLGIVAAPEQRIARLPLVGEAELHQIVHDWNATQLDVPLDRLIPHLIAEQAQRSPTATALVCDGQTLTYGALEERSNQFARALQRKRVGLDQPVGLCVQRSINMVVAMLGILKAGGAYVPLDPDYPAERLAFMAQNAHLAGLVVDRDTAQSVPDFTGPRIAIDADWEAIAQESAAPLAVPLHAGNLAYIIYTSGSTGVPKGVQISHGALINFIAAMRQQPGMSPTDVGLALTSISFDIAGLEIYLPLVVGARLVVVSREVAQDARLLSQVIADNGVTFIQATPATWRSLIEAGWQGTPQLTLLCGGEALNRDLAATLLARGGNLWNMYGPTETTIWSTLYKVDTTDGSIAIGRPIANTQIAILDAQLQPTPIGVPGELYIGGWGLARGYRGRADLTAERFIADPFTGNADARLYKTGDAARYRADGTIEYLGRLDSQVKVRGFRIELGEIETVLTHHPAINQAVVIVREDIPGDQRITAYLTVSGDAPAPQDLRMHLQEHLPNYMIPAAFVVLPALPLTPNGKVDRRALPAPDSSTSDEQTYVAPTTPDEIALAAIWSDLLGIDPVGVTDNFFELGGHSLLATQLMSRIRETFGIEMALRTLFEAPTVETLAVAIAQLKQQGTVPSMARAPIMRSARRQRTESQE